MVKVLMQLIKLLPKMDNSEIAGLRKFSENTVGSKPSQTCSRGYGSVSKQINENKTLEQWTEPVTMI